jgi:hypothetical protein
VPKKHGLFGSSQKRKGKKGDSQTSGISRKTTMEKKYVQNLAAANVFKNIHLKAKKELEEQH